MGRTGQQWRVSKEGTGKQPIPTPLPRVVVHAGLKRRKLDLAVARRLSSYDDQGLNGRLTGEGRGMLTSTRKWRSVTPLKTVFGASIQIAIFRGDDEVLTEFDCHR